MTDMKLARKTRCRKNTYATEGEALVVGSKSLRKGRALALRAYYCTLCRGYHLTKRVPPAHKEENSGKVNSDR